MERKRKKKHSAMRQKIYITIAAASLLLIGTLAWQAFDQYALNESIYMEDGQPGGRLHDDYNGSNKDVYVENYAAADDGVSVFARIQLMEYFEYGTGAGTENPQDVTVLRGDIQKNTPLLGDPLTWDVYQFGSEAPSGSESIRTYRDLAMGGETIYMPTFNKNIYNLESELNGTLAGPDGDRYTDHDRYFDYTTYVDGEESFPGDVEVVDPDNQELSIIIPNQVHTAQPTLDADIISMADWKLEGGPVGNYWVYDTDGWAYWAAPIEPQTATGLLIDEVLVEKELDIEWYYGVYVRSQIATAGDWGKAPTGEDEGTGMYESEFSEDGIDLLNKVAGIIRATKVDILHKDGSSLAATDLSLSYESSLELIASVTVHNETGAESETDVKWTVEEVGASKSTSGLPSSIIDNTLTDGVFQPIEEMAGYKFNITATSVLTPSMAKTIQVSIYDPNANIELVTKDDARDVKSGTSLEVYAYMEGTQASVPVTWAIAETSGNSGVSTDIINATISDSGVFSPTAGMAGCSYTVTATTTTQPTKTASVVLNVYSIGSGNTSGTASIEVTSSSDNLNSGETMAMSSTVTGISDESVTWSVTKRSGTTTLSDEEIAKTINATTGVFTPQDEMTGCVFIITGTSNYDDALVGTKDIMVNKGTVTITNTDLYTEIGTSLSMKATVGGLNNTAVNWSVAFKTGSSTLDKETIAATIGKTSGIFTPIDGMAGCTYTITVSSIMDDSVTDAIDVTVDAGSVQITTTDSTLSIGNSLTMKASVSGVSNSSIKWEIAFKSGSSSLASSTVSATIGENTGVFTPIDGMAGCTYTIKATSRGNEDLTDTHEITINHGDIDVTSTSANLNIGSDMSFTAKVTGVQDQTVTWSIALSSGTTSLSKSQIDNTISTGGVFTPVSGMAGCTFSIIATSNTDDEAVGSKDVSVNQGSITVTSSDTVNVGSSISMGKTVYNITGNGVTWSVEYDSGSDTSLSSTAVAQTIDSSTGVFAPVSGMGGNTYTITATSTVDNTVKGTKSVSVNKGTVTASTTKNTLDIGGTATLSAVTTNPSGSTVTWVLSIQSGSTTLTNDELQATLNGSTFTASSALSGTTVRFTAISTVDTKISNYVDIVVSLGNLEVTSSVSTVDIGDTLSMSTKLNDVAVSGATWSIAKYSGTSSLTTTAVSATINSGTGVFTPVSGMKGCVYTITATYSGLTATKNITVNTGGVTVGSTGNVSSMTLSNSSYTLTMTKSISNLGSEDVTWSIAEQGTSIGASLSGVLSTAGVLTATDAMAGGTYRITATSKSDTTVSGYKDISIKTPTITVTRGASTVNKGGNVSFSASVSGMINGEVTWTKSNNTLDSNTYVSTSGVLYVGAESDDLEITVTATPKNYTSISDYKTVTVNKGSVTLSSSQTSMTLSFYDHTAELETSVSGIESSSITYSIQEIVPSGGTASGLANSSTGIISDISSIIVDDEFVAIDEMMGCSYKITAEVKDMPQYSDSVTISIKEGTIVLSNYYGDGGAEQGSTTKLKAVFTGFRRAFNNSWSIVGSPMTVKAGTAFVGSDQYLQIDQRVIDLTIASNEVYDNALTATVTSTCKPSVSASYQMIVTTPRTIKVSNYGYSSDTLSNLVGSTSTITLGGIEFYVLDVYETYEYVEVLGGIQDVKVKRDAAFLWAKNPMNNTRYQYDSSGGKDWSTSSLRTTVNSVMNSNSVLSNLALKVHVESSCYDKFFILNSSQFSTYGLNGSARSIDTDGSQYHWLRNTYISSIQTYNAWTGVLGYNQESSTSQLSVRPAFWVAL